MQFLIDFLKKPYIYLFIILIGILLKFYKLQDNFFWDDEIATVLHTTGISMDDYEKKLPVNRIVNRSYYDNLLTINDKDFNIADQMTGLGKMPQLTPGHYYFLIFWTRIFGDNFMSYRYFSVFIFIITLPFIFLLTRKIFNSDLAAWIATSLFAVSPFFQFYAQEARYNILWSVALICLHYALLKAIEQKNLQWWAIYSITGIIALGTNILSGIILLAHLVYYMIYYRKNWKPIAYSLLIIFLGCLPWLTYVYINKDLIVNALSWQTITAWTTGNIFTIINWHLTGMSEVFINFDGYSIDNILPEILKWLMVILIITGFIYLYKKGNRKQFWFITLISLSGVIILTTVDLIRPSFVSMLARYQLLNFAGIIILVAFVFSKLYKKNPLYFSLLFIPVIALSIFSSKTISDDPCLYKRGDAYYDVEDAAELYSGNEKILLISDYQLINPHSYTAFMSLIFRSKNRNLDILYSKPAYPDFRKIIQQSDYEKIYALYLSDSLRTTMLNTFNNNEMVIIKDRKLFNMFYLPVYSIHLQADSSANANNITQAINE